MASKPKKHIKFTPSPNNIRVESIKELRDKLDFGNLSPVDILALRSAAKVYINYVLSQPTFKEKLKDLDRSFGNDCTDEVLPDK